MIHRYWITAGQRYPILLFHLKKKKILQVNFLVTQLTADRTTTVKQQVHPISAAVTHGTILPGTEDHRLQFLNDDPILLQNAVCEEKSRASSDELDLKMYHTSQHSFQVVTFDRLRCIYKAGLLSIRLDNNKLHVFVTSPIDTSRFDSSSVEISQIPSDRTGVPPIVTELLSALDVSDDPIRYIYLLYDVVNDYWELIGSLPPPWFDR